MPELSTEAQIVQAQRALAVCKQTLADLAAMQTAFLPATNPDSTLLDSAFCTIYTAEMNTVHANLLKAATYLALEIEHAHETAGMTRSQKGAFFCSKANNLKKK
jgi:hypothetical protein